MCFPFASALVTWLLHLHLHDAHVYHLHDYAFAFTSWTLLCFSAFSARTFAGRAIYIPVDIERELATFVEIFQGHLNLKLV